MINFKKILLLVLPLLTFLGIGAMVSNIQSDDADELLAAHGLTNNTRYFRTDSDETISTFLKYLDQHYPKHKIQLHLDSNYEKKQVLVWANSDVKKLPTESGRYFSADDFKGKVSFAVLGPKAKTVNVLEVQNNRYVLLGRRYYSVIGEFKNYPQVEMDKYYLTTGVDQPTAQDQIKNYRIVIDAAPKVIKKVARHYHASLHVPSFVQQHHRDRLSIMPNILMMIAFVIVGIIASILLAVLVSQQAKLTHLRGDLLRNWVINRSVRLFMAEGVLALVSYVFLHWHAFYSDYNLLKIALIAAWLGYTVVLGLSLYYLIRKDQKVDAASKRI